MIVNNTCASGNNTACQTTGSAAGLAVGLTVFFLLLIVAAVMVYKYRSEIRDIWSQFEQSSQKKEDYTETPQANSHEYSSMTREQPTGQNPVYENLNTSGYLRRSVHQDRTSAEPDEDLYLECDLPDDDAIYSNDPVCHFSLQEEDVYIVPDS